MTILVIAEHDQQSLKAATLNTVTAARKIGGDIHVLVAGSNCTPPPSKPPHCKASAWSKSPTPPTTKARPPRT
jgi:electron transfer flavoprotein alpha subunit